MGVVSIAALRPARDRDRAPRSTRSEQAGRKTSHRGLQRKPRPKRSSRHVRGGATVSRLDTAAKRSEQRPSSRAAEQQAAPLSVARLVRLSAVALVAMIATAVVIQAQQVAGQQVLEEVRAESQAQSRIQADLRAQVAEAEAPSALLRTAEEIGMVEPAAVVAVPVAAAVPSAPSTAVAKGHEAQGRG